MFSSVFLKTLYDMRRSMFGWAIIFVLLSLLMVSFFPSMEDSTEQMQEYMDNLPDAFKGIFGADVDISTFNGYLSIELFGFFFPFMMLAFTVSYGAGLISQEEDTGSLDVLLATPLPRWRVIVEKALALAVFTVVQSLAALVGILVGGLLLNIDGLEVGTLIEGLVGMTLLALFFGMLALGITGIKGDRGTALGITLAVAAISYLLFGLADVANIPDVLLHLSPWYYYNGPGILNEGLQAGDIAFLSIPALVFLMVGILAFQRRDLGT